MTTQDLTANRDRIISKIRSQITNATADQVKDVMTKMVAMLPQFASEKATKSNIDKLTMKATLSYIKYGIQFTAQQSDAIESRLEIKRNQSLPSSLQY